MSRPTLLHRATAGLLIASQALVATGCTGWHNQQGDVASIVAPAPKPPPITPMPAAGVPGLSQDQSVLTAQPESVPEIRVTTSTRGTIELRYPRVTNDSLYGLVGKSGTEVAFPVAEVTSVETRGSNAGGTVLLVVGVLALTFGVLVAATMMSLCDGGLGC